jgi:uncharacterized membrane protein (DUF106 family)
MSRRPHSVQENLFGHSELTGLRNRVHELDQQISIALKNQDYQKAKKLTDQQAELLQVILEKGDNEEEKIKK